MERNNSTQGLIRLLSDTVASQIAAGEVIQRPASAVKELLENAVDAGSSKVEVYIKDSGKTLIQVIDDGCGMSPPDARMAFERHATSKIRSADDLFTIKTMGFRGEALASIAAISHVELKTNTPDSDIGTLIEIEGNDVKKQQPAASPPGTSISVKNLFYNVPARRNFLKSNAIEARHIIDEFERVAYANPDISFSLNQNGLEVFRLPSSNVRQRIVNINGATYNERLVPVSESTTLLSINGFVAKPEFSRKTRGEQFFFVNKRFIKDGYLHHAVTNAFEELLPKDSYVSYWLYIDIDPSKIDVNIHPTKTEIKFEDERSVYAIVRAAVKRSLGQYSVSPTLNFDREKSFDIPHAMLHQPVQRPGVTVNTGFNPFTRDKTLASSGWEKLYDGLAKTELAPGGEVAALAGLFSGETETGPIFQLGPYIISKLTDALLIVDAPAAREKILYHKFSQQLKSGTPSSQQSLFPISIHLSPGDSIVMLEMEEDMRRLGFDIQEFGKNTFAIHGVPSDIEQGHEKEIVESLIEQFKNNSDAPAAKSKAITSAIAHSIASRKNDRLTVSEMQTILSELQEAEKNSSAQPCMILLKTGDIAERFKT